MTIGAQHRPLARAVLDELRSAIVGGAYPQGERLVEEELAERFGVSRNPIRQALHDLAAEGFVVVEPRRGARVATMDARDVAELFEMRAPLEGLVAGLAAERRTDRQLEELRRVVEAGSAAVADRRLDELPALNTRFHHALADAAGNQLLSATLGRLSDIIRWVYAAGIAARAGESWREHAELTDAIAAGDRARAERVGVAHIVAAAAGYGVDASMLRPFGSPVAAPSAARSEKEVP